MKNHFANYRQESLHHQLPLDLAYTSPDAKNDQVQQQSNRNCHIVHTPHRSGYDGNLEQRHNILPGNVQHNDEHFCIDGYDKHGNTSSNINRNRQNFPTSYRPTTNIAIEQNKPSACNYDNVLPTSTYHFPDDSRYLPRDMYRHAPVETSDSRPYSSFAFKLNMAQNRLIEQRQDTWPNQTQSQIKRSMRKAKEPEKFDGQSADCGDYIVHFENVAHWNDWDNLEKAQQLIMSLKGNAQKLLSDLQLSQMNSYSYLLEVCWVVGLVQ
ncbi:hypothetical protein DPMN_013829 [Dreissena polymorpha]|uniref:Uncharacterized protein n=1 Tax=Dreissena polymorpha TaxID=45954 RepID=A0A9D4N8H4_DREPO|nr:hypothetical protein DPMN_013829 [Dreissena polymorpha]